MGRLTLAKTNFTAGEISPRVYGRGDLRSYENGAAKLRNVFVHATGGVSRRWGLRYVATLPGDGRLLAFEFNTEQTYLLAITAGRVDVYRDGAYLTHFSAPWTLGQIPQLTWTQSADTLFVCHPEVAPRRVTRSSDVSWSIANFAFDEAGGVKAQPFFKFGVSTVTLQPSGLSGSVTLTASANTFVADHVGTRFRIKSKEVEITAVGSPTSATANVIQTLVDTAATDDWEEQAFSAARGWPVAVTFHQNRLVFGGSRDLPNRLWLSRVAEFENFDLGTGLDDEAIEFGILSDQVNAVRAVFSGRHLQVFTSGAEWMVTGDPLTPAKMQVRRQTRVGSCSDCTIPPRSVDGATVFVSRNRKELREFIYTDLEQAYQANDMATVASHMFVDPVDQDWDADDRLFHSVLASGEMATLTLFRTEQVTAWARQVTDGAFRSVAVVGGSAHFLVRRGSSYMLEHFDSALGTDCALTGTSGTPKTHWTGLGHLESRAVKVLADGIVRPDAVVASGAIDLDSPASAIEVGLPFESVIEPLPPTTDASGGAGLNQVLPARLVRAVFRVQDTSLLTVDSGLGPRAVTHGRTGQALLDRPLPKFTGDRTARALGWVRGLDRPLWRVAQSAPLPLTLLSVISEIKVNET
ncbi:MAG: hypothetical protein FJX46_00245 [Alphaproteobacteria bacterium]|nr:hypothetical protein [Alphaproteobacteria bacterium]